MSREIKPSLIQKWARENPSLEISLWIETEMNTSGQVIKLKCKACTKFEKEISGMKKFKTTWIDGYTGGAKLCGLKEHVGGKPHGKVMRSFKATVLKLPSENDQRELETSITPEEMSRLTRKANIAYFAAKNDME